MSVVVLLLLFVALVIVLFAPTASWMKPPAVVSLIRKPVDITLWLDHHRNIGIRHFYIRLEDSPGWVKTLQSQSDVTLVIGESDTSGNNYETLQHRQHEFVSWALEQARGSYSWLFHIDADELLHGDLSFIHTLPNKIKCLHMQNVEAVYDQANNDTCFSAKQFLKCAHGAPCKSYANGKGAGRVEHMVEPYGPHMFTYTKEGASNFNYDVPFDTLRVLHFDACSFGSWAEKFYHLGKQQRSDIPFPYYNESIDASTRAFDVYQRHKMNSSDVDKSHMWIREYFTQS